MKTLVHILSTIYLDAFREVNVLLEESYRSMREIHSKEHRRVEGSLKEALRTHLKLLSCYKDTHSRKCKERNAKECEACREQSSQPS